MLYKQGQSSWSTAETDPRLVEPMYWAQMCKKAGIVFGIFRLHFWKVGGGRWNCSYFIIHGIQSLSNQQGPSRQIEGLMKLLNVCVLEKTRVQNFKKSVLYQNKAKVYTILLHSYKEPFTQQKDSIKAHWISRWKLSVTESAVFQF